MGAERDKNLMFGYMSCANRNLDILPSNIGMTNFYIFYEKRSKNGERNSKNSSRIDKGISVSAFWQYEFRRIFHLQGKTAQKARKARLANQILKKLKI